MWRLRDIGRRRPNHDRDAAVDTVWLLDSVSFTASYTDPNAPEEASTATDDIFASVTSYDAFESAATTATERTIDWGRVPFRKLAIGTGAAALLTGMVTAGVTMVATSASPPPPAHERVVESPAADRLISSESDPHLAPATSTPNPAVPLLALAAPTSAHEVFGYAPYWSLSQASQFPATTSRPSPTSP